MSLTAVILDEQSIDCLNHVVEGSVEQRFLVERIIHGSISGLRVELKEKDGHAWLTIREVAA